MAWIEVHQSLPNHKKTLVASDILDIPPVHFMGHLICFWLWALDNAPDGNLKGISARIIARAAQWDGDPQQFLNALLQAGFIDQVGDSYVIHDWYDYAGRLIEKKRQDTDRKQDIRRAYENGTIQEVKRRDGNYCRYCGREVDWTDRKTDKGATYDHVDPRKPATVDNLVVACRACNSRKGNRTPEEAGMTLLPPPNDDLMQDLIRNKCGLNDGFNPHQTNLTLPNLTIPNQENNNTPIGGCADAEPDGSGQGHEETNTPEPVLEQENQTEQEQPALAAPKKRPKKTKPVYGETERALVDKMRQWREEQGCPPTERDWHLKELAIAAKLLKTYLAEELEAAFLAAQKDEYWRARLDSWATVERFIPKWRLRQQARDRPKLRGANDAELNGQLAEIRRRMGMVT